MPYYRTLSALAGLLASIWYISTTSKPLRLNWHIYQFAAKDHCFGNPCLNNGTCQSNPENYTCSCPPSYTGKSCAGLLNKKRPQQNLTEPNAHLSLLCLVYSGVLELRKCYVKSAQLPLLQSIGFGISELLAVKKYAVQWSTQYNETQSILTLPFIWFTERDYCHSHPCRHNGTCHNLPNDYKCECPSGLTGINCEG